MTVLDSSSLKVKLSVNCSVACLGCGDPTCMTVIHFICITFIENHKCFVLVELYLRSVLLPGSPEEQNKFILVKVRVKVLITTSEK